MMPESAALSMWPADTVSLVPGFRTLLAGALAVLRADEGGGALGVLLFFVSSLLSPIIHGQFTASARSGSLPAWQGPRALIARAQLLPPVNIRPQRAEAPPYTHA